MDDSLLEAKARDVGFCQRNRKLTPRHFIEMLLCKSFSGSQESLVDHAIDLKLHRGIDIKKQSLQNKFNDRSVMFVKSLISTQLSKKLDLPSAYLNMFPAVLIQDSTRFGLPTSLKDTYAGYGGRGAKAGGKIQFAYELKTHQIYHSSFESMTANDLTASKNNEWIKEGSLVLRDLGYYSNDALQDVIHKKAFFVSKVKPKTALFTLKKERLDLVKLVRKMRKNRLAYVEKMIFIGHEKEIKARAIFSLVPDAVKKRRATTVAYKAKGHNYTVQKEYKIWTSLNVFITNVDKETLKAKQIMDIYRLRWQVELVFKTWKSYYKIDHYKCMRRERVECYLYATLLLILLHWRIFSWLNQKLSDKRVFLSLHKFSKLMVHLSLLFNQVVIRGKDNLILFLKFILDLSQTYLQKETKKNKIGFAHLVESCRCVYC
jgi:hypothetical protein